MQAEYSREKLEKLSLAELEQIIRSQTLDALDPDIWTSVMEEYLCRREAPRPDAETAFAEFCERYSGSGPIFAAEEDGTYSTKYKVGDTKMVSVNGSPVAMQIVAIDGDELADGTGNAKITWLCLGYQGKHNMNSTNTTSGGWASCAMRQYLIDSVLPNIDSTVRAQIKSVNKTYYDYASSSTKVSADSIWIPSFREVGFGTTKEDSGVIYSGIFTDNAARIKNDGLYALGTAATWWLRSASNGNAFCNVGASGSSYNYGASASYGVVFGFCT